MKASKYFVPKKLITREASSEAVSMTTEGLDDRQSQIPADNSAPNLSVAESVGVEPQKSAELPSVFPVIDQYRLALQLNGVVPFTDSEKIRKNLTQIGYKPRGSYFSGKRLQPSRSATAILPTDSHYRRVNALIDGNGLIEERLRIEPNTKRRPPRGMDQSTNLFKNPDNYFDPSVLTHQCELIQERVEQFRSLLNKAINTSRNESQKTRHNFTLKPNRLELCWHKVVPSICSQYELDLMLRIARTLSGFKRVNNIEPDGSYLGFVINPCKGFEIGVYKKQVDLIRIEARFSKDFFTKDYIWVDSFSDGKQFNNGILYLSKFAWGYVQKIYETDYSFKQLAKEDAEHQIRSIVGNKFFPCIMILLQDSCGWPIIKSDQRGLYNAARRLVDEGVFWKPGKRSQFALCTEYHSVLRFSISDITAQLKQ